MARPISPDAGLSGPPPGLPPGKPPTPLASSSGAGPPPPHIARPARAPAHPRPTRQLPNKSTSWRIGEPESWRAHRTLPHFCYRTRYTASPPARHSPAHPSASPLPALGLSPPRPPPEHQHLARPVSRRRPAQSARADPLYLAPRWTPARLPAPPEHLATSPRSRSPSYPGVNHQPRRSAVTTSRPDHRPRASPLLVYVPVNGAGPCACRNSACRCRVVLASAAAGLPRGKPACWFLAGARVGGGAPAS